MGASVNHNPSKVLAAEADIEGLLASPFGQWLLKSPIKLELLSRTPDVQRSFETRVNYLASVCGCAEGSITGATTLIILVTRWVRSGDGLNLSRGLSTLAFVICAALIAKALRVTIARIQLRSLLRSISNHARAEHLAKREALQ